MFTSEVLLMCDLWFVPSVFNVVLSLLSCCSAGHAIFKITYHNNHDYKALYFESDAATVNEIVLKVSSSSELIWLYIQTFYVINNIKDTLIDLFTWPLSLFWVGDQF